MATTTNAFSSLLYKALNCLSPKTYTQQKINEPMEHKSKKLDPREWLEISRFLSEKQIMPLLLQLHVTFRCHIGGIANIKGFSDGITRRKRPENI